jgi:hypothetical protein
MPDALHKNTVPSLKTGVAVAGPGRKDDWQGDWRFKQQQQPNLIEKIQQADELWSLRAVLGRAGLKKRQVVADCRQVIGQSSMSNNNNNCFRLALAQ